MNIVYLITLVLMEYELHQPLERINISILELTVPSGHPIYSLSAHLGHTVY